MLCALVPSVVAGTIATNAFAQDANFESTEHWVTSAALELGVYGHTGKGNTFGSPISGPRVANPRPNEDLGPNLVEPERSREEVVSGLIGATWEVMTPQLTPSLGHPRMFLDVNVTSALAAEVQLAIDGDPGVMGPPDEASPSNIVGEAAIQGRGTKITVQPQGPQVHAGIGTAFTIDRGTNRIRIKPSLVYSRTILDVSTVTHRAIRLNNDAGANFSFEDDYRTFEYKDNLSEVYHGLGPALEIEYEPGLSIGPFFLTLYAKAHASQLFGDLKTNFQGNNPDPTAPDEFVRSKYTQDRWNYRGSTGVRLRWDPMRGR